MEVIYGEVGSGKTKKLIYKSNDSQNRIITYSRERAEKLIDKAERYGICIPKPLVVGEDCIDTGKTYIIDNIEKVMEKFLGSKVECMSYTV